MGRVKNIQSFFQIRLQKHPAQSFVEFALALPILLLLMFGIIEMGRLMQAWLALENGARFAVRYAITGQYLVEYCDDADAALGSTYAAADLVDGVADCKVPDSEDDYEKMSNELQDWARLPSIRANALAGATGIALDEQASISGNYITYLTDAYATGGDVLSQLNRGNPTEPGYFSISTCSNRSNGEENTQYLLNPNGFWYDTDPSDGIEDPPHTNESRYPYYCELVEDPKGAQTVIRYVDDAGGPGDRVRVILTYRHKLITPFLSSWWPTLKLTTQREGVVEKFRTSRVTGLTGGIGMAATHTYTASITFTPSPTLEPSLTFTNTSSLTPSKTPTQALCGGPDTVLREVWYDMGSVSGVSSLTNYADYPNFPDATEFVVDYEGPTHSGDPNYFGDRYRAYICAPYDGVYKFYVVSDDQSDFYLNKNGTNSTQITRVAYVNNWANSKDWGNSAVKPSGWISLSAGQEYYSEVLHVDGWGGDNMAVGWIGPNDLSNNNTPQVIDSKYLRHYEATPLPTAYPCNDTGSLLRQHYAEVYGGNLVSSLTGNTSVYPGGYQYIATITTFNYPGGSTPDLNNYGEKWLGYICAPFTGDYKFALSSDDQAQIWLSSNDDPSNIQKILEGGYVGETNISDYSDTISLEAGHLYFVQALWKENTGGDYLRVEWRGPEYLADSYSVITGQYLVPGTPDTLWTPNTYTATRTYTASNTRPTNTASTTPSKTLTPSNTPITPTETSSPTVPTQTSSPTVPTNTHLPTNTFTPTTPAPPTDTSTPYHTITKFGGG